MSDEWLRADMNPDDPRSQGYSPPTDTGLSHEAFAESYPNEVQFHYDGGFRDGVKAALERVQAAWIGGPDAHFHAIAAIKKDLIGDEDG